MFAIRKTRIVLFGCLVVMETLKGLENSVNVVAPITEDCVFKTADLICRILPVKGNAAKELLPGVVTVKTELTGAVPGMILLGGRD